MNARRVTLAVVSAPLVLSLLVVAVLLLRGQNHRLEIATLLPVAVALSGLALSLILLGIVGLMYWRTRWIEHGRLEAAEQHRQRHRQFLSRLDHELKNPLTAIRAVTAAGLNAAEGEEDDPQLSSIDTQAQRMSRLLTDLRKLAELETVRIDKEDVDLEETTRDAVDAVADDLAQRHMHRDFSVVFPSVPWPLSHVQGDPDLLYSAIYNMVSNAAKYSDEGASIEVRGREDDGKVTVEVADTGIGIPQEEQGLVFDELARARNARGLPGSGLGLALVSTIVRRHGGTTHLVSREGVGTSVALTLPIHGASQES